MYQATMWLAGCGALLVFASGAATAGLQAALGLPARCSRSWPWWRSATQPRGRRSPPRCWHPWDVLGQLLPPGAALSLARNIVYHVDIDITRPLVVLSAYALAGGLIMVCTALIRQRKTATRAAASPATA